MAYLPLSTANLPDPAIDPAQGSSPQDYFDIDTYSGTSAAHERSNFTFQPDFLWLKCRNVGESHFLFNVESGVTKYLRTDSTGAETTNSAYLTSFDADGFTLGTHENINETGETYVAWAWKANGSGVSNTYGSITSTVSANTESGFSIVSYTGTGSNATVGHGLSSAPEMVIVKRRDSTSDWVVYHTGLPSASYRIYLNYDLAQDSGAAASATWNDTDPTSTVFSIGTNVHVNVNTATYIAYCFHSVEGFSKFGSYTGNGSADGPFVYTGFRPAFVMIKRTDSANYWMILDDKRNTYNPEKAGLYPNLSDAESNFGNGTGIDFLSNGFKHKDNSASTNASGGTYIYMAFAETPFKYSLSR